MRRRPDENIRGQNFPDGVINSVSTFYHCIAGRGKYKTRQLSDDVLRKSVTARNLMSKVQPG